MIDAYPLHWPEGKKRTDSWKREAARFGGTFTSARDELVLEIKRLTGTARWGDAKIIVSTNIALRRDGLPLANQRQPDDPGVAVYFVHKQRQRSFACDRWKTVQHNMTAIMKTIEALRGIERWGTGDMVEAAFAGFTALPPPPASAGTQRRHWSAIFGVQHHTPTDDVRAVYRRLSSQHHPDRGGDPARMSEINVAFDEFRKERGLA